MRFLLPTGIGDSVWALHKIQAVRDKVEPGGKIEVCLVGSRNLVDSRALDFVKRFDFVSSAAMRPYSIHNGEMFNADGTYNYLEDGMYEFDGVRYCILIPNAPLEHGIRLENWLPQYPIDWSIFKHFQITEEEQQLSAALHGAVGDYAVFYPGPLHGNTEDGHNRNALWKPEDWINLGQRIHDEFGLAIVTVGAPYDASYFEYLLKPKLNGIEPYWTNLIGKTNLGELWSITSKAKFVISYQAGVGIISTYLGTPTGIFWRPYGDSISPHHFLTFDERMASAWVPPAILEKGTHLPLIYRKHGIKFIMDEIHRRGWVDAKAGFAATRGVRPPVAEGHPSQ